MATSSRAAALLVVLLTAGGVFGCSGSPATTTPTEMAATAHPSPTPASSARQQGMFCTVDLPESWRSALAQGKISLSASERLNPTAVAGDGSRVFGALYSDAWSGVVAVDRQGSITRIRAFDNPDEDQVSAAFDGRWLVWEESHSIANWSDWDIRAWDSRSGQVFDIATAPRVNGATVSGPFVIPVVSQGRAAWVQANQSGKGEVHLYDLAERRDRVLSAGTVVPPVLLWGSKLLWAEKGRGLTMADTATGEPSSLPQPLALMSQFTSIAASTEVVAWTEGYRSAFIWRVGEPHAEKIFVASKYDGADWVKIAGDIVAWVGLKAPMVADLRSGSVAALTGGSNVLAAGNTLLLLKPIGPEKKEEPGNLVPGVLLEPDVVDVTKLPPLPGCPS